MLSEENKLPKHKALFRKRVFVVLLILFLGIFAKSAYSITMLFVEAKKQNPAFIYTNSSTISYQVYLYPNDYIKEPTLPSGKTYITDLVQKITMTMEYDYSSTVLIPMEYQHNITATIYGLYNQDPTSDQNPVIWEKEFIIKPLTEKVVTSDKNFQVIETFDIDISQYNAAINSFKEHFAIPTVSYLEIKMPVTIRGNNVNYSIGETTNVVARIPLSDKVLNVDAELQKTETKKSPSLIMNELVISPREVTMHAFLISVTLILIGMTIHKMHRFKKQEDYESYLLKLKNEYNEIIVETNNMVDITNFKPVSITTFEELLNLSNSLLMPVMLFERPNVSCFYIVKDKIMYTYLLKNKKSV